MTKVEKALYYAKKQIQNFGVYVWGGQGEKLKKLTALKLAAMEDTEENAARVIKFIKKNLKKFTKYSRIFDCSGFVICCLIYAGVLPSGYDNTANGLLRKFNQINFHERQPGDLVFKYSNGSAYHVGILIDKDTVAECAGRDKGLILSDLTDSWNRLNRPTY